jgi:hypothetical protein
MFFFGVALGVIDVSRERIKQGEGLLRNSSDPGTGNTNTDGDGLPASSSWPNGGESSGTSVE